MAPQVDQSTGKPVYIDDQSDPSISTLEDHTGEENLPTGNTSIVTSVDEPSEEPSDSMDTTGDSVNHGVSQSFSPGETSIRISENDSLGHADEDLAHQQTVVKILSF